MTAIITEQQAEDWLIDYNLEEGVCHQREEMQREVDMEGTRTNLDTLQDFIKNGFNEPKFVF